MAAPSLAVPPAQAIEQLESTRAVNINGATLGRQWPRDRWLEAIWECSALSPSERIVAHVFGRYAGKKEITWCVWDELIRRTGIKSKTTISKFISKLVNGGWLLETEPARQHYSARYQMTIPVAGDGGQTSRTWTSERSRRTKSGRLAGVGPAPDVQNLDVPDVQVLTPDIQNLDPSTQTQNSDLQPGGTLPPDPLRTERPQAVTRTDHGRDLTAVPDYNDTRKVTSRTRAPAESCDRPLLAVIDDTEREIIWTGMQSTIDRVTQPPATGATA
jgi:hypothetical protein